MRGAIQLNVSNDTNVLNQIFQATQCYKPHTQSGAHHAQPSTGIRHRFVSVMSCELPFGKDRPPMHRGAILNHLPGGRTSP